MASNVWNLLHITRWPISKTLSYWKLSDEHPICHNTLVLYCGFEILRVHNVVVIHSLMVAPTITRMPEQHIGLKSCTLTMTPCVKKHLLRNETFGAVGLVREYAMKFFKNEVAMLSRSQALLTGLNYLPVIRPCVLVPYMATLLMGVSFKKKVCINNKSSIEHISHAQNQIL